MDKKVNNSARTNNKKLSTASTSSNNIAAKSKTDTQESFPEFPDCPQQTTDSSESDEESVSEILLACLCLRPDLLVESFPLDQVSTEEIPDSCSDSCDNDEDNDDNEEEESENDDDGDEDDEDDEDEDDLDEDDDEDEDDDIHGLSVGTNFLLHADDDLGTELPARAKNKFLANCLKMDKTPVLKNATLALDEAAQALTRMRSDSNSRDKNVLPRNLLDACNDNDVNAVRKLLIEGNTLNEATDDGDSLLSLACSAGYYELAQVLLAMSAQVEDRGQKNDCTPLMEAASAGHIDIIELLIRHGADVNAQSSTGNTPLMYACAGGHVSAVKTLLAHGANVEDHNENGHTPLMEAASAGHVEVAKILLEHGAGINTHSNEFKESALTLACYKGHLDMVRFLLEAGADQEHKTDEMHTALMEASMDGHVEVARLLLDSGAQVNMPTDSFESPLTLAACGGHVDLAMLLIERGANIEEVNDEGYTPLMEAAREGHDEMVSLLLTQGANINAQTEETQETALTLACCGGFLEVADYLIKHGANIELGASTPLMEAAQEGHLDLVKFLLESKANVHAQTQTGDTALTYACENGHTDVAEVLLYYGAELEHESEGGRTPLMKACRAGHICTVKFLIQKGADVNRQTTNNDHTPLSLACAGGHQQVVELLLSHCSDPFHKLKDNSTMLIEAAKGGHTGVVQLLLDFPTSIPNSTQTHNPVQQTPQPTSQIQQVPPPNSNSINAASQLQMQQQNQQMIQTRQYQMKQQHQLQHQQKQQQQLLQQQLQVHQAQVQQMTGHELTDPPVQGVSAQITTTTTIQQSSSANNQSSGTGVGSSNNKQKNLLRKNRQTVASPFDNNLTSSEAQQVRSQPVGEDDNTNFIRTCLEESFQQKMDNTLQKNIQFINDSGPPPTLLPSGTYVDITTAAQIKPGATTLYAPASMAPSLTGSPLQQFVLTSSTNNSVVQPPCASGTKINNITTSTHITAPSEVSQSTAISDRPKAKPVSKKEGKNLRKTLQQQQQQQAAQAQVQQSQSQNPNLQQTQNSMVSIFNNIAVPGTGLQPQTTSQLPQTSSEEQKAAKMDSDSIAATSALLTSIIDDDKEKIDIDKNRQQIISDFESFQKSRLNYLTRNTMIEKIVKMIDPPKSPSESPVPESTSPSYSKMMSMTGDIAELSQFLDAFPDIIPSRNDMTNSSIIYNKLGNTQSERLKKEQNIYMQQQLTQQVMQLQQEVRQQHQLQNQQPQQLVQILQDDQNQEAQLQEIDNEDCAESDMQLQLLEDDNYEAPVFPPIMYSAGDGVENFQPNSNSSDQQNPVGEINRDSSSFEWVEEVMQALNVTNDISNAFQIFQEIAANFNSQDLEHYANLINMNTLNNYCKTKWSAPQWPANQFQQALGQIASEQSSPTNEDVQISLPEEDGDDKHSSPHQYGYPNVYIDQNITMEQIRLYTQIQNQNTHDPNAEYLIPLALSNQAQVAAATGLQVQPSVLNTSNNSTSPSSSDGQQKSSAEAQQQTKLVLNVDPEKAQQSLQLLFNLNTVQEQQNQEQQTIQSPIQNPPPQRLVQQTQPSKQRQIQLQHRIQQQFEDQQRQQNKQIQQPLVNSPQSFQAFQLPGQQTPQSIQTQSTQQTQHQKIQTAQSQSSQQQVLSPAQTQFCHQKNFSHVQAATQTQQQPVATNMQQPENMLNVPSTSTKINIGTSKKAISDKISRKEKSRYGLRQPPSGQSYPPYADQASGLQTQYPGNIPGSTSTGTTTTGPDRTIDVDSETDSNHDTALTLACAGGHEELVDLLIKRGANIEHRDKKGFTPLILAATAGHEKVVETLINRHADLEAQSERTKDTPLSLACSGGRYEVVELLLKVGANKEHRNVSDYTPLSLAASGGYVNIIKLLLQHGAEINSRTGSKLGISPLMLAAMNGHTAAVRLLLDMGSDINAQMETNRNTALTLACFQGRHEVVSLLLDRKANVEHRAETGLTPLMEAASGGYIEVGKVLLDKGADVNAAPVPSSRDTALTIAADKGHLKFVELLLARGAAVEVKNKKGNSPLWLAANGGHLNVVEALYHASADIDSQDNRKVSCLMAAFRKGHTKVVKWMVNHVTQFPSDQEMTRYISVVEKEAIDKCHECVKIIRAAKETQATKANINASILLKELDMEKSREESRKAQAAKRRERKKRRKQEKREAQRKLVEGDQPPGSENHHKNDKGKKNQKKDDDEEDSDDSDDDDDGDEDDDEEDERHPIDKEELDSGIDANSQGSCASNDVKTAANSNKNQDKNKKNNRNKNNRSSSSPGLNTAQAATTTGTTTIANQKQREGKRQPTQPQMPIEVPEPIKKPEPKSKTRNVQEKENVAPKEKEEIKPASHLIQSQSKPEPIVQQIPQNPVPSSQATSVASKKHDYSEYNRNGGSSRNKPTLVFRHQESDHDHDYYKKEKSTISPTKPTSSVNSANSGQKREEGWKEVGRKYTNMQSPQQTSSTNSQITQLQQQIQNVQAQQIAPEMWCKKIQVPVNAISRVIGRGGSNINAIRAQTGAHIEVEKQGKTQGDRSITIKGGVDATKQAHILISTLVKDPDADVLSMLTRSMVSSSKPSSTQNSSPAIAPAPLPPINVWENKQAAPTPPITNPKNSTFVSKSSSNNASSSSNNKTTTPTPKTQKPPVNAVKNMNQPLMRPTPSHTGKILINEGSKKGILSNNGGPPSQLKSSSITYNSSIQALKNSIKNAPTVAVITSSNSINSSSFASKLTSNFEKKTSSAPNFVQSSSSTTTTTSSNSRNSVIQSPSKQSIREGSNNLPAAFPMAIGQLSNSGNNKIFESGINTTTITTTSATNTSNSSTTTSTNTSATTLRSITPIGPPIRSMNLNDSSHIVNVLDLSTSSASSSNIHQDITAPLQAKMNDLHVSGGQGNEYSLFNDNYIGSKWPEPKPLYNPLKVNAMEMEPPVQVDASKAPGYRGNSINSPVSSKTSSNSATPPSSANSLPQPMNQNVNASNANGNSLVSQNQQIQQSQASHQQNMQQNQQTQQSTQNQNQQQNSHISASNNPTHSQQIQQNNQTNAYQGSGDMNTIKPIGQGAPIQRPMMGANSQPNNRQMDQSFGRQNIFDPLQNPVGPVHSNLLQQFGGGDSIQPAQNFGIIPQNPSMSRLNPKASSFLSNCNQSKLGSQPPPSQSNNQFGGTFHQSNNSSNMMKSGGVMPPFFNPPPASNGRQMHQNPQQVNQTQRNWFQDFGGLESPSMSPNNQNQNGVPVVPPAGQPQPPSQQSQMSDDSRKIARPIGSERASWKYSYPQNPHLGGIGPEVAGAVGTTGPPPQWMVDKPQQQQQQQWPGQSVYPQMGPRPYDDIHTDYYMQHPMDYSSIAPPNPNQQNMNYMQNVPYNQYMPASSSGGGVADFNANDQPSWDQQDKHTWPAKWTH